MSPETLGTKPKKWLREPTTGAEWLIKYVTFNTTPTGTYAKGDDWAERAVGLIAGELGVPVAQTELAYQRTDGDRRNGILVRSMVEPETAQLVHGNELLAELELDIRRPGREGYSIDNVRRCLDGVAAPQPYTGRFSAWEVFAGYLVLDAVCGNTDRHEENWAVLRDRTDTLAPSFDHASSLGFNLSDVDRSERLATHDRLRQVDAWASRAESPFAGRPHPVDLALDALAAAGEEARQHWIGAAVRLDPARRLAAIPADRISEPARAFALEVIRSNTQRILSHV